MTRFHARPMPSHHVLPWCQPRVLFRRGVQVVLMIVCFVLVRLALLIRMGVGKGELFSALLDFPPPEKLPESVGPFPLFVKFHKVAGSTVVDTLWHTIQCDPHLSRAWRQNVCGEYETHKNLLFMRGGLSRCALTRTHRTVVVFRLPVDKFISTLYWYPPDSLRAAAPWTTPIQNW